MKVDISVKTEGYTIREVDPNDDWDIGEDGLYITGVTVTRTERDYADSIDGESGDPAVVLVEHYSDGCTFGSSEYAEVKGIFKTYADAESFAHRLNTDHGYFGCHIGFCYFDVVLP
jgi:hypothetical protein